jgi:hypothetical protein
MTKFAREASVLFLALATGLATDATANAGTIVVPGLSANTDGNSDNGLPFNNSQFGTSSVRYQQVFDASQFAAFGGPQVITQIAFRPDAIKGSAFATIIPNIQIDLSTTSATPFTLSSTFAFNVGADDVTVLNGPLALSSAFTGPAAGPKDFDIVINLPTPFVYDPANGNLLLDVRNFSAATTTQFDATTDPSIGRAFTITGNGVNDPTGNTTGGYGLVTRFSFAPALNVVAEPNSALLAGLGFVGILGARLRKRRALARTTQGSGV